MPRPLIIKVNDHRLQPNKKASGSINVQLLKSEPLKISNKTYSSENHSASNVIDQSNATDISQYGSSMVRSLINRYESSTAKSNLMRNKSRSLVDFPKPLAVPTTKTSQDDSLYNKRFYNNSDNEKFDFKRVYSKFESPSHLNKKIVTSHQKSYSNENINFVELKQKAKLLLENLRYESNSSLWRDQVVELLLQIENFDASINTQTYSASSLDKKVEYVPVSKKEERLSTKILDIEKDFNSDNVTKVKDIKNIFEEKSERKQLFSRLNSANYSTYFGGKGDENEINNEQRRFKSAISIEQLKYFNGESFIDQNQNEEVVDKYHSENFYGVSDEVDNVQDSDFMLQMENSGKVDELKNFFESEPVANWGFIFHQATRLSNLVHGLSARKAIEVIEMYLHHKLNLTELVLGKHTPYKYLSNGQEGTEEGNIYEYDTPTTEETFRTTDNRLLPSPRIFTLDGEPAPKDIETSLARIKELTELLGDYEHNIDMLTDENAEEGNYINEHLIRILIKLDEVATYRDKNVLAERKNAIRNVQSCIKKLKDKVNI